MPSLPGVRTCLDPKFLRDGDVMVEVANEGGFIKIVVDVGGETFGRAYPTDEFKEGTAVRTIFAASKGGAIRPMTREEFREKLGR